MELLPFAFGDIDMTLPASLHACRTARPVRIELSLRVRDRAGDVTRATRRFSERCTSR
jgi:hypothetical protein